MYTHLQLAGLNSLFLPEHQYRVVEINIRALSAPAVCQFIELVLDERLNQDFFIGAAEACLAVWLEVSLVHVKVVRKL